MEKIKISQEEAARRADDAAKEIYGDWEDTLKGMHERSKKVLERHGLDYDIYGPPVPEIDTTEDEIADWIVYGLEEGDSDRYEVEGTDADDD